MITLWRSRLSSAFSIFSRRPSSRRTKREAANRNIPIFFDPEIHHLLKVVTNADPEKVHVPSTYRSIGSGSAKSEEEYRRFRKPKIELLTDSELHKALEAAPKMTEQRLQMPPVIPVRKDKIEILESEPRLTGILPEGQSFVFTDISISDSISNRTRSMVARESDGTLRSVDWSMRDRLLRMYFPLPGQRLLSPLMFEKEYLQKMLDDFKYLYILERACVQFEPDDPIFIKTREAVYNHLIEKEEYGRLESTRHFGPLVLHTIETNMYTGIIAYFLGLDAYKSILCYLQLIHRIKQYEDWKSDEKLSSLLDMKLTIDNRALDENTNQLVLGALSHLDKHPKSLLSKTSRKLVRGKLGQIGTKKQVETS